MKTGLPLKMVGMGEGELEREGEWEMRGGTEEERLNPSSSMSGHGIFNFFYFDQFYALSLFIFLFISPTFLLRPYDLMNHELNGFIVRNANCGKD